MQLLKFCSSSVHKLIEASQGHSIAPCQRIKAPCPHQTLHVEAIPLADLFINWVLAISVLLLQ
jgi:hypothetical protein